MEYYKAKPGTPLTPGQLYTLSDLHYKSLVNKQHYFEVVEIPKKKTHIINGARFEKPIF